MMARLIAASAAGSAAILLVAACTATRTAAPTGGTPPTAVTTSASAQSATEPPASTVVTTATAGAALPVDTTASVLTGTDITKHAYLTGEYTCDGVDENGDGLLDTLMLHVGLQVQAPGQYVVSAVLADGDGQFLTYGTTQMDLAPGPASMPIKFAASAIRAADKPGPYLVKSVDLLLNDSSGKAVARQRVAEVFRTQAYELDQLAPPALEIGGPVSDRLLDQDGDSVVDAIGVDVKVVVSEEGEYSLTAFLNAAGARHFVFSDEPAVALEPGTHTITLVFSSLQMQAFHVQGRFDLDKLLAYRLVAGRSERIDSWPGQYQTQSYSLSEFPTPTD